MKTLKIGIADYGKMKARTLAIARGEYQPAQGEPTIWFTSLEGFANVLSKRNREQPAGVGQEPSRNRPQGKPDRVDQCR